MMIKLWIWLIFSCAYTIDAHQSKTKRSLFEPWSGPPSPPSFSAPWIENPWRTLKTTPDLYPASSSISKPPPVIITKEIRVPVDKYVPVEVAKLIPYPIEKLVPVSVEKIVRVPVDRIIRVPIDRIVRVPVEIPATPAPAPAPAPVPQMITLSQPQPVQPVAPVAMPAQQALPLMLQPRGQLTVPILITAQGLSISTSGLLAPAAAAAVNSIPIQTAAIAPQPVAPPAAAPMMFAVAAPAPVPAPAPLAMPVPVSNNSTLGISVILNGLPAQRLSPGFSQGLTYINALPDLPAETFQGNTLLPEVGIGDYGILDPFISPRNSLRWKRNVNNRDDNTV